MKKEFIGIDVSKNTLDVFLYQGQTHKVFDNNPKEMLRLLTWVKRLAKEKSLIFCFEHTGIYNLRLCQFMQEHQLVYYVIPGLEIKRSLGIQRGKNDKADAKAIARYASLFEKELTPYHLPAETILNLKRLLTYREKLVRQRTAHLSHIQELKTVLEITTENEIMDSSKHLAEVLSQQIKRVEQIIKKELQKEEEIAKTYQNIISIKGVGLIVAATMISATNNFKAFKTWRQFACYAGIAPFEHQSGISVKGKTKVSSLGDKQIKALLSQSAATALQHDPEMKTYYQRRLKMGKTKMSTLNGIRNKIVSRIFAVAKRNTPYVELMKFAA